mmetsp:Transcript_26911/g.63855  ORF Transcript_26911/g.63855 Transcript_26911/m.63855 type:complete len:211 (+) Transcript_26911:810-1442(+)
MLTDAEQKVEYRGSFVLTIKSHNFVHKARNRTIQHRQCRQSIKSSAQSIQDGTENRFRVRLPNGVVMSLIWIICADTEPDPRYLHTLLVKLFHFRARPLEGYFIRAVTRKLSSIIRRYVSVVCKAKIDAPQLPRERMYILQVDLPPRGVSYVADHVQCLDRMSLEEFCKQTLRGRIGVVKRSQAPTVVETKSPTVRVYVSISPSSCKSPK